MLYQKLLAGQHPYCLGVTYFPEFEVHRHPELELNYCLKGNCRIRIDKKEYFLQEGDLVIIGSMVSHEIVGPIDPDRQVLTIEVGPMFLMGYFELFSKVSFQNPLYRSKDNSNNSSTQQLLFLLLEETASLYVHDTGISELLIKSNLYKICAYILQLSASNSKANNISNSLRNIAKIEKALEIIHDNFSEPLTIDYVADLCGYSCSNFCKIFKQITGDTFHNVLNRHRVENACCLLQDSDMSIDNIATHVGFTEVKSFCRVFKKHMGQSASEYRKNRDSKIFL